METETKAQKELRHFCYNMALAALPVYEAARPEDNRPRRAVEAVRQYLEGEIGLEALVWPSAAASAATEIPNREGNEAVASAAEAAARASGRAGYPLRIGPASYRDYVWMARRTAHCAVRALQG